MICKIGYVWYEGEEEWIDIIWEKSQKEFEEYIFNLFKKYDFDYLPDVFDRLIKELDKDGIPCSYDIITEYRIEDETSNKFYLLRKNDKWERVN